MSNRKKEYKTPQAVASFIKSYRVDVLMGVQESDRLTNEQREAIKANLQRLEGFLLAQCSPAIPEPSEAQESSAVEDPIIELTLNDIEEN